MSKKEHKIAEMEAKIEYYQEHIAKLEELITEISQFDGAIENWVQNDERMTRNWEGIDDLHCNFMEFMGHELSKSKFGRLLTESGMFIKRNGKKGREWKLIA